LNFTAKYFANEGELNDYSTAMRYEKEEMPGICAAIEIEGGNGDYKIKLRYDDNNFLGIEDSKQQIPTTRLPIVNNLDRRPDEDSYNMYRNSGFTFLQYLISQEILKLTDPAATLRIGVIPIKTTNYVKDMFLLGAGQFLAFIIILCYLAPLFRIISIIVQDKELKTREGMKMMGLKDSAYWLSFLCYYLIIFGILSVCLSSISVGFVFRHSNWFITFIYYMLYGLSVFAFAFFLASFFSKARVASITGTMIYFASYVVITLIQDPTAAESKKNAASLLPTCAAALGSIAYVNYESGQYGVTWSNINEMAYNYKFSTALIMLAIDTAIYGFIGWYLDNVIPNPEGVAKPWYFLCTSEFWTGKAEPDALPQGRERKSSNLDKEEELKLLYPDAHFQQVGDELKRQEANSECLKIRYLNKYFGQKHSVCDFSVNMYKGQIFALLGPNGAGKTTTISMLSGLLPASSGTASFSGMKIFDHMDLTREKLGVCPQHDVLFESLTPKEHLEIFAAFKGREDIESINKDVMEILNDIELNDCADMKACNLSGGQRRKLSIGIAFIGNSNMIFLDEPTSGIDISARKRVWAMLKKYKAGKVTILTTHYMEEAEELGDRIGIMANGNLKCVGGPLFLKTVYGAGYNLVICRKDGLKPEEAEKVQDNITNFLTSKLEGIKLRKEAGREVTYFMPKEYATQFKKFFADLDANKNNLQIESYGMTTNTLEEIFLRVARGEDKENRIQGQKITANMCSESIAKSRIIPEHVALDSYSIVNEPEPSFWTAFTAHFTAIFIKRLLISIRNWGAIINELIVPIILILFGMILTKIPTFFDGDTRWLEPGAYELPQRVIINDNAYSGNVNVDTLISYFDKDMPAIKYTVSGNTDNELYHGFDEYSFNTRGVDPYRYGSLFIKTLDTKAKLYEYVIFCNISSQDSAGAFVGIFTQSVMRIATGNPNFKIKFANSPLPLSYEVRNREDAKNGNMVTNALVISFALLPASIVSFIVREREDSLKHQQLITGVSLTAYWVSNAALDMFKSFIPGGVAIGLIYAFDVKIPMAWLIIILYAICIIPFTYFSSFFFNSENAAQTSTLMFHFFCGVVLSPVFTILRIFDSTRAAGKGLGWILRIIPSFSLSYGISNIAYKKMYALLEGEDEVPADLSFNVSGGDVLFLCIMVPIYIILIGLIENQYFDFLIKLCEPEKKDEQNVKKISKHKVVLDEEHDVENTNLKQKAPAVLCKHIRKLYRISPTESTLAVNDVSFITDKGQCLALLGTNGAGKTTTFKLITRDVMPSAGEIYINGLDLNTNFTAIRKMIGYGPQYESAYMAMTVRENLEFYAKLKGIPDDKFKTLIDKLIVEMYLGEYEHVQAGTLSGGNKRKLTVAIALLGNPPIVLLDEPSTGVDPQAKRFMWHIIQRISTKNKNTAVILTTHSMEEAEYLCTKMAIMVNGDFCCIGTPQKLKDEFGKGFEIQISIPPPTREEEQAFLDSLNVFYYLNLINNRALELKLVKNQN